MAKRNPKQEGSNIYDCKPQVGLCPLNCNQCFYNREGAFYVDIDKPHLPSTEEVDEGIMRVNCGHDSNIQRNLVEETTRVYKYRFFNTSIPSFHFPAPVVFTANREEEGEPLDLRTIPENLMYIRLRVSSTNLHHIDGAVDWYASHKVPVVLTFMAYYDCEPENKGKYIWKKRHVNSYWCATREFMAEVLKREKEIGGRLVTMCGTLDSNWCRDCKNCETYYWQTIKHLKEIKD